MSGAVPAFEQNCPEPYCPCAQMQGYVHDISALYRSERQKHDELEQAKANLQLYVEELERKNSEVKELAFIASHNLQEPLRKIFIFGDRLKESLGNVEGPAADHLERMGKAVLHMQELLGDLLRLSQVDIHAQPFGKTSLETVVQDVFGAYAEIVRDLDGKAIVNPLPTLDADAAQMKQLFLNLVSNALKFRKKDTPPVIVFRCKRHDDGFWEISVEDNGIGFDQKYGTRIFRPFVRLHGRNEYPGVGMGLAICEKIVARHKGRISVISKAGHGSIFSVMLPEKQRTAF